MFSQRTALFFFVIEFLPLRKNFEVKPFHYNLSQIDIFHVKELAYIIYDVIIIVMTSQFRRESGYKF